MDNEDLYLNSSDYRFKLQLNMDKEIEDEILQLVYFQSGMTKNYGRRGNMQKDISNAMGEALIKELRDPKSELSKNIHSIASKEAGYNIEDNICYLLFYFKHCSFSLFRLNFDISVCFFYYCFCERKSNTNTIFRTIF